MEEMEKPEKGEWREPRYSELDVEETDGSGGGTFDGVGLS